MPISRPAYEQRRHDTQQQYECHVSTLARPPAAARLTPARRFDDSRRYLAPLSATGKLRDEAICVKDRIYNVLFLCTGNSARSILAEALINRWGNGRFRGFSAGSHPKGAVHPIALKLLQDFKFPTEQLRSKSWDEFAGPAAPALDFIITVCDNAAGEVCPYWPGQPMTAHWGVPDPAAVEGTDAEKWRAFNTAFKSLESRIKILVSLPLASLDRTNIKQQLDSIGRLPLSS